MKCERCKVESVGYDLHDYCEHCSKNLCDVCMHEGRCSDSADHKHKASNADQEASS